MMHSITESTNDSTHTQRTVRTPMETPSQSIVTAHMVTCKVTRIIVIQPVTMMAITRIQITVQHLTSVQKSTGKTNQATQILQMTLTTDTDQL